MPLSFKHTFSGKPVLWSAVVCASFLSACAAPDTTVSRGTINDPYEEQNRGTHEFNRSLDKVLVRPTSSTYGTAIPTGLQDSIGHFSDNLSLPGDAANHILQGNGEGLGRNILRFAINTTLGIGGLFDPASQMGLERSKTDFGETLYVWGVEEGAYVELPFFGPSTSRDTVGLVVDYSLDPVRLLLPTPERYISTLAMVAARLGDRHTYTATIDSVLYESVDSYTQARSLYLQNRRYELGGRSQDDYDDPYGDADSDPYDSAYSDPYEDLNE
ncbi:phospholipid-binding lipoprotein MlaA [Salinihabitans flavidus]|uniref:Phospholipid-binding lipoprotein MlaA n=1 Tax=Salinihabitans flavidus TaxID=569882 RepID=A0A1H8RX19_9RHOB|nr:VacJ family lipoprotein [Salinihabitans flavidus]SEO71199.1 phospholipid-binding lipoprotein MlaA [Salinihabitans flavidus]